MLPARSPANKAILRAAEADTNPRGGRASDIQIVVAVVRRTEQVHRADLLEQIEADLMRLQLPAGSVPLMEADGGVRVRDANRIGFITPEIAAQRFS